MIKAGNNWNGPGAMQFVEAASWDRLRRAVVFFWDALEKALGKTSNPRPYHDSAKAGEVPHKRTGFLAANVIYELDQATSSARVGLLSNAIYGLFLEIGTRRMAARPWLIATLKAVFAQMQTLVGGGGS